MDLNTVLEYFVNSEPITVKEKEIFDIAAECVRFAIDFAPLIGDDFNKAKRALLLYDIIGVEEMALKKAEIDNAE